MSNAAAYTEDQWNTISASEFGSLRSEYSHFSTFQLSPHAKSVDAKISAYSNELSTDPYTYRRDNQQVLDQACREGIAQVLGVPSDSRGIALVESTTMGVGLVYSSLALKTADEILTTEHEHVSTYLALQFLSERTGAQVRRVRLYGEASDYDEDRALETIESAITTRTRLVALTWVHSGTGVRIPAAKIGALIARRELNHGHPILFGLDSVHAIGVISLVESTVESLNCDFLFSSIHKWLWGPRGTGFVWARERAWSTARPTIVPFASEFFLYEVLGVGGNPGGGAVFSPGGYHSFEHRWAVRSATDLYMHVGPKAIQERTLNLNSKLKEGLSEIAQVQLVTPRPEDCSAGIVCFLLRDRPTNAGSRDFVQKLYDEHQIIASITPYMTEYVRLAPSIGNSVAEVERAIEAVKTLCTRN